MWLSLHCSLTFAVLLSLHIVTFLMFFFVYVNFLAAGTCLSWGLSPHSSRSLSGSIHQILATLAVLAERLPTQSSVQNTWSTPLWMDDKASSHCLKTGGIHRSKYSKSMDILHSFRYIHMYVTDKDLSQSFQWAHSIDSATHTPVIRSHAQVHTPTVFLIQRSWVINSDCC